MILRFDLPTAAIALASFLLDSYEDVGVMTTLERRGGTSRVEWRVADDFAAAAFALLDDLARQGIAIGPVTRA